MVSWSFPPMVSCRWEIDSIDSHQNCYIKKTRSSRFLSMSRVEKRNQIIPCYIEVDLRFFHDMELLENSWEQVSQWIGTVPRCVRYMTYVLYPTVDSGIPCWSFLLDFRRPCLTTPEVSSISPYFRYQWQMKILVFPKMFGMKPYPINCMVFSTIWCILKIWDPPQSPKGWRWKLELWSSVMDDH